MRTSALRRSRVFDQRLSPSSLFSRFVTSRRVHTSRSRLLSQWYSFAAASTHTHKMSAAAKQQRAEVAKVKMKEGFAHLKTGIFKWSKDYMLAGPAFWDAGMGFAYSGLPIEGQQAYLEAAKCYDCEGVTHKAASCYQQAATLAEKQGDLNTAAKWLDEAADRSMLGSSPDAGKAAQTLQKAALMVNIYIFILSYD